MLYPEFDRFHLLGPLGKGSYAEVYEAFDPETDEVVAVKILDNAKAVDLSLLREGRAAQELRHPFIVEMYPNDNETGAYYDERWGRHSLVFEFLSGATLRDKLGERRSRAEFERDGAAFELGRIPWPLKFRYLLQLARSLEYAHHKKITHRDVKPENVFVHRKHYIKLLDLGLAKFNDKFHQYQTRGNDFKGTMIYSPPEVLQRIEGGTDPDPRDYEPPVDIFAFGVVAYELLLGFHPYLVKGQEIQELIRSIREQDPFEKDGSKWSRVGDVPLNLRQAIRRCLRVDPKPRRGALQEVMAILRREHPVLADKKSRKDFMISDLISEAGKKVESWPSEKPGGEPSEFPAELLSTSPSSLYSKTLDTAGFREQYPADRSAGPEFELPPGSGYPPRPAVPLSSDKPSPRDKSKRHKLYFRGLFGALGLILVFSMGRWAGNSRSEAVPASSIDRASSSIAESDPGELGPPKGPSREKPSQTDSRAETSDSTRPVSAVRETDDSGIDADSKSLEPEVIRVGVESENLEASDREKELLWTPPKDTSAERPLVVPGPTIVPFSNGYPNIVLELDDATTADLPERRDYACSLHRKARGSDEVLRLRSIRCRDFPRQRILRTTDSRVERGSGIVYLYWVEIQAGNELLLKTLPVEWVAAAGDTH